MNWLLNFKVVACHLSNSTSRYRLKFYQNLYINVMVGSDKPLARLKVVCRLSVEKGQVLQSEILDTSIPLWVLPSKKVQFYI